MYLISELLVNVPRVLDHEGMAQDSSPSWCHLGASAMTFKHGKQIDKLLWHRKPKAFVGRKESQQDLTSGQWTHAQTYIM